MVKRTIVSFFRLQLLLALSILLTVGLTTYSAIFTETAYAAAYGGCGDCAILDSHYPNLIWAFSNASPNYIYDSTNSPSNNGSVNVAADPICPGSVVTSNCPYVVGSDDNADQQGHQLVYVSFRLVGGGNCAYATTDGHFDINTNCNTVSEAFELIDNGHQLISVGATNYLYNKLHDKHLYAYACGQNSSNTKIIWTQVTNGDCVWSILKLAS